MPAIRIAIIGSAGRRGMSTLPKELYNKMKAKCISKVQDIEKQCKSAMESLEIILVSGGAALSDHLAVTLFLEGYCDKLELHVPAHFDMKRCMFDEARMSGRASAGAITNYYHKQFSSRFNISSLKEIKIALDRGAIIPDYIQKKTLTQPGALTFWDRNKSIAANADYMIAFSTGTTSPTTPGTKYTWSHCPCPSSRKIFISLDTLCKG